jgi:hypothetical protein
VFSSVYFAPTLKVSGYSTLDFDAGLMAAFFQLNWLNGKACPTRIVLPEVRL